jgi:hypothetical protein
MPAHRDLSGLSFNGVEILRVSHVKRSYFYVCRCSCGTEFTAEGDKIKRGHTRSCGCINESLKHGKVGSSTYGIWAAMKTRCLNQNSPAYPYYGARGITVCERWMEFRKFLEDMGERPPGLSIDRIDNDKGYEPGNCRWATPLEQSHNRRKRGTCLTGPLQARPS